MGAPLSKRLRQRSRRRGVVMLDVILAMAVIALCALVLMPIPRGSIGANELRAEAIRVAAQFRKGRAMALRGRQPVDIVVDADASRVAFAGGETVAIRDGVRLLWVTSDQCPRIEGIRALRYLPDGRSCGGVLTLSAGALRYQLRVDWLTGRVEMSAT